MIHNRFNISEGEENIPSENSYVNQEMSRLNSEIVITGQVPNTGTYGPSHPQTTLITPPHFATPGVSESYETYTGTILERNMPATSNISATGASGTYIPTATTLGSNMVGPTVEVEDLSAKKLAKEEAVIGKHIPGVATTGLAGSTVGPSTTYNTATPGYMGATTSTMAATPIVGGYTGSQVGPSPTVTVETMNSAQLVKEEKVIEKHVPTASGLVETQMPLSQMGAEQYPMVTPVQAQTRFVDPNLSEVRPVTEFGTTEEFMKNSQAIDRTQEVAVNQSQWEQQQTELASMRYENHSTFEAWEKNRTLFFNDRLAVTDSLMAGMEKQLQWLDAGFDKTVLFFREREAQELEFARTVKHSLPQLGQHFGNVNRPEAMMNFSQGLQQNDDFHARQMQNAEIMGQFIKKDILDWTLLPSEKLYKESSSALRTPMTHTRKKLDHLANKRHRAYGKYVKLYDSIQKQGHTPNTKEGGLFKRQLKYSLAAREELRVLRLYNEQGLTVVNEFARLSTTRLENLQKAFTLYYQKFNELNRDLIPAPEPVLGLISRSNSPDAITTLFQPVSLMSPEVHTFLVERLGKQPIHYTDLNGFLVNFPESVDPARSSFVLREFEAIKQGGLLKKPRAVNLIATTNNNLLIVERKHEERESGRVKDPMQLRFTRVENVAAGEDGTTLKVVERTPGRIFDHTHSARLKFPTSEQAQEFLQFVNNQPSDV